MAVVEPSLMQRLKWLLLTVLMLTTIVHGQPTPLVTSSNRPLLLLAHDLTTNGIPPLAAPSSRLMVSGVQPVSAKGGRVSMINTQVWVRGLFRNNYQYPTKIRVNKVGDIYVVGTSQLPSGQGAILTAKYSPAGTALWTNLYSHPQTEWNSGDTLDFDASGNVYVAGHSGSYGGKMDVVLIKYTSAGVPLWTNRFNNTGTNLHGCNGMAIDAQRNVYVGVGTLSLEGYGHILLKYNQSGVPLSTNRFQGSPRDRTDLFGPFLDATGDVYLCGGAERFVNEYSRTRSAFVLLKYSKTGAPVRTNWLQLQESTYVRCATMDRQGNFVVSGEVSAWQVGYFTAKFSTNGGVVWTNYMPGPGYSGGNVPILATDHTGNTFITAGSPGAGTQDGDYTTVKVNPIGIPLWTNRLVFKDTGPANGNSTTDNAGNFYLTAEPGKIGGRIATIKHAPDGTICWTNVFPGDFFTRPQDLVVDSRGDIYVLGTLSNAITTIKYSDYIRYTPPSGFAGKDSFTFTVVDSAGQQTSASVDVLVEGEALVFNIGPTNLHYSSNGLHLRLDGVTGADTIVIQGSTNLIDWQPLGTNNGSGGSMMFLDSFATNGPRRFYRARQVE